MQLLFLQLGHFSKTPLAVVIITNHPARAYWTPLPSIDQKISRPVDCSIQFPPFYRLSTALTHEIPIMNKYSIAELEISV